MRCFRYRVYDKEEKQYSDAPFSVDQYGMLYVQDEDEYWEEADDERYILEPCLDVKDINNKVVHVGDIVFYTTPHYDAVTMGFDGEVEHNAVVEWSEDDLCFGLMEDGVGPYDIHDYELEIIGNVHDNPELIEKEIE